MAERVYHVRSTSQLIILNRDIVERTIRGLQARQDDLQIDVNALKSWLSSEREREQCASEDGTGDTSGPSDAQ